MPIPNIPTGQAILNLPMEDNDSGSSTVRGYLLALLHNVWSEGEGFSGKRPFGNSSWEYDLFKPLVQAGFLEGTTDEWGNVDDFDYADGTGLIHKAIDALGEASSTTITNVVVEAKDIIDADKVTDLVIKQLNERIARQ
jgi:hypothetical protein